MIDVELGKDREELIYRLKALREGGNPYCEDEEDLLEELKSLDKWMKSDIVNLLNTQTTEEFFGVVV